MTNWIKRLNNELILQGVKEDIRVILISQALLESGRFAAEDAAWGLSKHTNAWGMTFTPRRHKKYVTMGKYRYAVFESFEEGIRDRLKRDEITFTHRITKNPIKGIDATNRADYLDYLGNSGYAEAEGYIATIIKISKEVEAKKWAKLDIKEFYGILLLLLGFISFSVL